MREMRLHCFCCMSVLPAPDAVCPVCGHDNLRRENDAGFLQGTVLCGQYVIGRALGRGGFGVTYMGYDINLDRKVAVKEYFPAQITSRDAQSDRLLSYAANHEDFQRGCSRAMEEGRVVSGIGQVPGVVQVYNVFRANSTVYLVMEYVEGRTLQQLAQENGGRLSWKMLRPIMQQMMTSLCAVHERHVLHRDVSPDNIMIRREDGRPVLLDFGAAHVVSDVTVSEHSVSLRRGYAPVEQYSAMGKQDARIDEYALCATMYHMLTGKKPPDATERLLEGTPLVSPRQLGADISAGEEAVLLKGMAVKANDRYPDMQALKHALEARRKTTPWKKVLPVAVCCALAVGAGVFALQSGSIPRFSTNAMPTSEPTASATATHTAVPTAMPAAEATAVPSPTPTEAPTPVPTDTPVPLPVQVPVYLKTGNKLLGQESVLLEAGMPLTLNAEDYTPEGYVPVGTDSVTVTMQDGGAADPAYVSFDYWTATPVPTQTPSPTPTAAPTQEPTPAPTERPFVTREETKALQGRIVAGTIDTYILTEEGTIQNVAGWNVFQDETDVAALDGGAGSYIILKKDGSVKVDVSLGDEDADEVKSWKGVQSVVADDYHVVAVKKDGTVLAVGDNKYQQCNVSSWRNIVQAAAGFGYTAGLKEDGSVVIASNYVDYDVSDWHDIVDIEANKSVLVGLTRDGRVRVTGGPDFGLADSETQKVQSWTDIVAVSTGGYHVVGLKPDGTVVAAGTNRDGQCNVSNWSNIVAVYAGSSHTVGLKADGTLVAVGDNDHGECNVSKVRISWNAKIGEAVFTPCPTAEPTPTPSPTPSATPTQEPTPSPTPAATATPVPTPTLPPIVTMEEAAANSKRISTNSGTVGILKNGKVANNGFFSWDKVNTSSWNNAEQVAAGQFYAAALFKNGTVRTSGDTDVDYGGQVYKLNTSSWKNIVQISAGDTYLLGLKADGTVVGTGVDSNRQISGTAGWNDIVSVRTSNIGSFGLKSDGTVVSTYNHSNSGIEEWRDVVAIDADTNSMLIALRRDGQVYVYGDRSIGEPGYLYPGVNDAVAVAAGAKHFMILHAGGTVTAWGKNDYGQLNNVSDWRDIVGIAAGSVRSIGVKADGTLVGAGDNDNGQLDFSSWDLWNPTFSSKNVKVGSYITFGKFAQGNSYQNKTDISWLVLAKESDRMLVISRNVLDWQEYEKERTWDRLSVADSISWGIEDWFTPGGPTGFYEDAFTLEQRRDIIGYPFLLTVAQAEQYFSSNAKRVAKPSGWALARGAETDQNGACSWWLTPSMETGFVAYVNADGSIREEMESKFASVLGAQAMSPHDCLGVRPAMWIALAP